MEWLDQLRKMKKARGETTADIAARTGVPEATLEKLFSGITKDPRLGTIATVVYHLGYTLDDLVPAETATNATDPMRDELLARYDQLNQEGRERLLETADDMVTSGKYTKRLRIS